MLEGRGNLRYIIGLSLALVAAQPLSAQPLAPAPAGAAPGSIASAGAAPRIELSAAQMFDLAERARAAGDFATAETVYRALAANPDLELRTEARFRLGMMLADQMGRPRDAAVEFRKILDEKPEAPRVRLELARMQALMGNLGAAKREFRAAQAGGLPPEVEKLVRFYANALSAEKPLGASIEVAIAPDSNINRATRADTLSTVIGDFTLDEDAKSSSGLGLALRGQAYYRPRIDGTTRLLVRIAGRANLYRQSRFDDQQVSLQVGPEYRLGADRMSMAGGIAQRWYGGADYSLTYGISGNWQHPLGSRAQLRVDASLNHVENRPNPLQSGEDYALSVAIDRAFSSRTGGGVQVSAGRTAAADPGFSDVTLGLNTYLFRELGRTTLVGNLGYARLEADARLLLYPRRRVDDRFTASIGATIRSLRIGTLAPFARLGVEHNRSTVGIYHFTRVFGELGLGTAF